jgi:iduronate 2-sulfatase
MRLLPLLLAFLFSLAAARAAEKLNVLFILSDDARPELGCYGAPVKTPHLDALAARSVRFDRAFCQYPLCNPSRTSVITGLRPDKVGVLDNGTHFRKTHPDLVTLPQLFKQHGYTSVNNGKVLHGGKEDAESWTEPLVDYHAPRPAGQGRLPSPAGEPTTQRQGQSTDQMKTSDRRTVLAGNGEHHPDHRTADAAIAALARLKGQPFFLTCGFLKPHAELAAPQRFYDLYPPEQITLPADFAAFPTPPPGFPRAALTQQNIDLFWNREANAAEAKLMIQAYRASVSWMDWNVGRVLKALDDNGLRETTIVVFWGDHGYQLGEMGKWSKHSSLFDVGTRVPLLISMPGAKGNGKASPRIVESLDIYPTLAALCGLQAPGHVQGRSLRPLLDEPDAKWDHPAVSVSGGANKKLPFSRAIRDERWRYIEWSGPQGGKALIDEQNDPHERTNLISKAEHAEIIRRLQQQLDQLAPHPAANGEGAGE